MKQRKCLLSVALFGLLDVRPELLMDVNKA
jgi:hypothetical protein